MRNNEAKKRGESQFCNRYDALRNPHSAFVPDCNYWGGMAAVQARERARGGDGNPAARNRPPSGPGPENIQRKQQILTLMKEKELYYSPETVVMELHSEGVVCASAVPFSGFGEEQNL